MSQTLIYQVLVGDAWQYDQWAQQISGGQWIGTEVFYQTPLYPYFLGIVYALVGHSVWAIRILQAILGSLACVLLARAGSRFFDNRVGWVAGVLLAIYPPAIFFDGILQKATLDLILMSALLWMISRQQNQRSTLGGLAIGGLLGLLILNRENAWVFVPFLLVWLMWIQLANLQVSTAWMPLMAFFVGMAMTLGPVGLRNYYVGGEFLLTTSQMGPNFYIGNHRGAPGRYVSLRPDRGDPRFERTDARLLAEQDEGRTLSPREVSQFWMQRSREDILADPSGWVRLLAWKWFLTWNQVEMVDGEGIRVHSWHSPVLLMLRGIMNFGVLTALAVAGVWLARAELPRVWILLGLTLAFASAVTIFYVFARYRYPLVPLVTIFAAFGLVQTYGLLRSSSRSNWLELLPAVLLGSLTAIATCWPRPELHSDEVTYFSVGTALNDQGRYEEARQLLNKALEITPNFPQAHINLGTTAIKQKQWEMAIPHLLEALRIQPNNPVALQNLASVRIEQGNDAEAEQILRQALRYDPYLIPALRSMGGILIRRGQPSEAVSYLDRAVKLDPQSAEARAELAMALIADKSYQAATDAFEAALELGTNNVLVANNFAWLLATGADEIRNGKRAVELALQACEAVAFETPEFLDTLAAAHAECAQFEKAIQYAERALAKFTEQGNAQQVPQVAERLEHYKKGVAFRDESL